MIFEYNKSGANICGNIYIEKKRKSAVMPRDLLPSLKDIAGATGVSIATVSRVLRNKGEISLSTKKHVLEVAERLGYHDNRLIYGIQTGRTKTIGVSMPLDIYFSRILGALGEELEKRDYLMLFYWKEGAQSMLKRFVEQRVDGVIMMSTQDLADNSYFSDVISRGLPIVTVDRKTKANVDFVGTDDFLGGRMIAEYLCSLGHRNMLYYQGPELATPARLRRDGFVAFCRQISGATVSLCGDGSYNTEGDETMLFDFLRQHPEITAGSAFFDGYACRLWRAAVAAGRRVPEDFSIVGFGDIIPANLSSYAMTTLDQDPERIARIAVERLFERIGSERNLEAVDIRIPPKLLIRNSALPPASAVPGNRISTPRMNQQPMKRMIKEKQIGGEK